MSFSPNLHANTWTAAKNEVLKGLSFKPMGFLVIFIFFVCVYVCVVLLLLTIVVATTNHY